MTRCTDWRSKLSAIVEERRRLPHVYGENDCLLFVADCVAAMTGLDIAAKLRGRYDSASSGLSLIHASGYSDLCALLGEFLEEIHPSLARAGDVMAFETPETGWALGMVNGERVTVLHPDGLGTLLRTQAQRAFKV
jgi:hypothetical protein